MTLPVDADCVARIAEKWRLRYVVLYGSHARQRATPTSDVDIAVKAGRRLGGRDYLGLYAELSACVQGNLDLWIIDYWGPIIAWEALWKGKLVWTCGRECESEYHWDRVKAFKEVADLEYLRRRLQKIGEG